MRILVLGGSVFVGRALVDEALAAGAEVTVFNRGVSGPSLPDGVTRLTGDRTVAADVETLRGRSFDLVVDTCGYVPADVALTADALAPTVGFYAFVSTINVFPAWPAVEDYDAGGVHDSFPDATRADVPADLEPGQAYGWLKVGCELAVQRALGPDGCSLLRAGSIVGPHDAAVGRLPWWIDRVSRGGEILVPGAPDDDIALIDARDLARFALACAPGAFEVPGPTGRDTRAGLMAACRDATGSDGTVSYVGDEWLAAQDLEAWTEVPLWAPGTPGVFRHHSAAAEAAGLRWRPLAETVADTWTWLRGLDGGWHPTDSTPGLEPRREAELLAAWHAGR